MIKVIIGLGNIGKQYEKTRHNAGFLALDELARKLEADVWTMDKRFEADVSKTKFNDGSLILAKPATLMNNSGAAVWRLVSYYKIEPKEILVIADDLNLDIGKVRIRLGGTDGGHNGLKSIIERIGDDFWRVRVGIGFNEKLPAEDYVLSKFSADDQEIIDKAIDKTVKYLINSGITNPIEETI